MKRWPFIRHIRWFYLNWAAHRAAYRWASVGIGLGVPNEHDLSWLEKIWKGEA